MATVDDVEVANASFPNVRQDLNDILEAITTNFSADTEPTTTYPNQFWYETDTNLLYIRNEADDAWITLASINQTTGEWEPRTAVIQAIDSAGIALKTDDGTTRFSISDAGVVSFENYAFPSADGTSGQVLSTDGSGTLTFEDAGAGDKIEEGNSSVEVVDTGTGHVAVTVDGSETARFDANGRLGIGVTPPDTTRNLFLSTSSGDAGIQITGAGAGQNSFLTTTPGSGANFYFGTMSAKPINFVINGATNTQMRLSSVGDLQFNSGYGSVATAYGCRAWVNFDGDPVTIREDGNVSSITDNGTGDYTVNFTTAMPDANYAAPVNIHSQGYGNGVVKSGADRTTSGVDILALANNGTAIDAITVDLAIFR